jgi:hypothetical protein
MMYFRVPFKVRGKCESTKIRVLGVLRPYQMRTSCTSLVFPVHGTTTMIITYLLVVSTVIAFPDGCPVCTVGRLAPQSLHLDRPFTQTGPISQGQYEVKVSNITLSINQINRIATNVDLSLILSNSANTQFRGIMIAINRDGLDLSTNLRPASSTYKVQSNCPDVGNSGITHRDNSPKSSAEGIIYLEANRTAFLDVNVVVANNDQQSIYYYSRFEITTVVSNPFSVPAPVPTPIMAPLPTPIKDPLPIPVPTLGVPTPIKAPASFPAPILIPAPVMIPVPTRAAPIPIQAPFGSTTDPVPVFAPSPVRDPVVVPTPAPSKSCGLFGLSIICFGPSECGFFRRLFGIGDC